MQIPWKYCECGCHGSETTVGGVYFSYYLNLTTDECWLSVGDHMAHVTGKKYKNHEEMNAKILEVLKERKKTLAMEAKELEDL